MRAHFVQKKKKKTEENAAQHRIYITFWIWSIGMRHAVKHWQEPSKIESKIHTLFEWERFMENRMQMWCGEFLSVSTQSHGEMEYARLGGEGRAKVCASVKRAMVRSPAHDKTAQVWIIILIPFNLMWSSSQMNRSPCRLSMSVSVERILCRASKHRSD